MQKIPLRASVISALILRIRDEFCWFLQRWCKTNRIDKLWTKNSEVFIFENFYPQKTAKLGYTSALFWVVFWEGVTDLCEIRREAAWHFPSIGHEQKSLNPQQILAISAGNVCWWSHFQCVLLPLYRRLFCTHWTDLPQIYRDAAWHCPSIIHEEKSYKKRRWKNHKKGTVW